MSQTSRWLAGVDTVVSTDPGDVGERLVGERLSPSGESVGGVASVDAKTSSAYGALTDSTRRAPADAAESVTINPTPLLPPMYCDE